MQIVPVGLYYTNKTTFRSEALLHFGQPFRVDAVDVDAEGQPVREAVRVLTTRIEEALRDVTLNAESESELHTAKIAERILASAHANTTLGEKLEFLKRFITLTNDDINVEEDFILRQRLLDYEKRLDDLGIEWSIFRLRIFALL